MGVSLSVCSLQPARGLSLAERISLQKDMDVKFLLGGKNFQPFSYIALSYQLTHTLYFTLSLTVVCLSLSDDEIPECRHCCLFLLPWTPRT